MFKKPPSNLKTLAPLRSSDRRKLKQKVISAFNISPEDGQLLVPDGLASLKFSTYLDEPGIVYLYSGDPLWFTVGRGSEELIPTAYTMWKKPDLLPFISTPEAVIPALTGGADLMIPGVIHHSQPLGACELVCIRMFSQKDGVHLFSVPLAVGRMALSTDEFGGQEKGKAVHILHVWKDHLWEMGSKLNIPASAPIQTESQPTPESAAQSDEATSDEGLEATSTDQSIPYTPAEITELLQKSLVQAISVTLSSAPSSVFPVPATLFYTNYILPSRPAFPERVLFPEALGGSSTDDLERAQIDPQEINIKASSHKSLTAFLKAADKQGLITTKTHQKHSQQIDMLIMSVSPRHPLVAGHTCYPSLQDVEKRAAKKAAQQKGAKGAECNRELEIKELWKPHMPTVDLFEGMGADPKILYTLAEVQAVIMDYVSTNNLVNPNDQAYVNLDALFLACLATKPSGKSKGKEPDASSSVQEFMKRDELTKKVVSKMQGWYEIHAPGKDLVKKKGILKPIQVDVKVRQGRKASTLITGLEPFLVVNSEEMAEELQKTCAGAASVSPVVGRPAGSESQVLVQGKQIPAVVEYLTGKGIPKQWIKTSGKEKSSKAQV